MADEYDSLWKEAPDRYFPAFLAFFFPAAHSDIAWEPVTDSLKRNFKKMSGIPN